MLDLFDKTFKALVYYPKIIMENQNNTINEEIISGQKSEQKKEFQQNLEKKSNENSQKN